MDITFQEQKFSKQSKLIILGIALFQGFLWVCLYKFVFNSTWFYSQGALTFVLTLLTIFVPPTIVLTFRLSENTRHYWLLIGFLVLALIVFGWQQGSQLPERDRSYQSLSWLFDDAVFLVISVFWFKVCFFYKAYLYEKKAVASYPSLFGFSWHNALTLGLSYIFTLIFYGVLMLCAGLFSIVEINYFVKLFGNEWFIFPVLASVFAYGVMLLRTHVSFVSTIQRIIRILLSALLPILIAVALLFVAVLPFTGVDLIWDKGFGSSFLLGFVYVTLFFFNAVYQDGSVNPYNETLSQISKYAISVLFVFSALCFYGLILRINQYGWTEERLWFAILTLIATAYVVLYGLIILFKKTRWSNYFGKANTAMALLIMLVLFLILTPIMSFKKISAQSQYNRFIEGAVTAEQFDFAYLSQLGNYGKRKLLLLQEHKDIKNNPELRSEVELSLKLRRKNHRRTLTAEQSKERIKVYPIGSSLDDKVWQLLMNQLKFGCEHNKCFIVKVDLNGDQQAEILFFKRTRSDYYGVMFVEQRGEQFYEASMQYWRVPDKTMIEKIQRLEITLQAPKWQDLYVDGELVPLNTLTQMVK